MIYANYADLDHIDLSAFWMSTNDNKYAILSCIMKLIKESIFGWVSILFAFVLEQYGNNADWHLRRTS